MLVIDGKRITPDVAEWWDILNGYDKVVTMHSTMKGRGRSLSNGAKAPAKVKNMIPMRFTIPNPKKSGVTITVIYSANDDIPLDTNGQCNVQTQNGIKPWHPGLYKITQLETKIRKDESPELLLALLLHPLNGRNYLYEGTEKTLGGNPVFVIAPKGKLAKEANDKDALYIKALSYLVGEKKVNEKKIHDLYVFYKLDPDILENEDMDGMLDALKVIAKTDPEKFIDDINNTMYDMKARVSEAFEIGVLTINDKRQIKWGKMVANRDHDKTIVTVPLDGTVTKEQVFVEYLVKKDDTGDVRSTLLEELEKQQVTA